VRVCGKASIDAVRVPVALTTWPPTTCRYARMLATLPDRLRAGQRGFASTGGLHAAGLFTADGEAGGAAGGRRPAQRGRQAGRWAVRERRLPLTGHLLLVSGRASFELVQKASMAGIAVLAAVSAPSTLAVDLAAELGLTLIGFLRGNTMNAYAGTGRIS